MDSKKRNSNIDFYRGIAAIGIISIHTAFWTGEAYCPMWFKSLTLLVDVPLFFFLSGKSALYFEGNVMKTVKTLSKTWMKWIYSTTLIALFCLLTTLVTKGGGIEGVNSVRELVDIYFFNGNFKALPAVGGSAWFMPYYFMVLFVNQVILCHITRYYQNGEKNYTLYLLILYIWVATEHDFFGVDKTFLFYSFFWMLGIIGCNIVIIDVRKLAAMILGCIILYLFTVYYSGIPIWDLQIAKFPPQLPYFFWSLFSVMLVVFFDKYITKPPFFLLHVGRNAIFYFAAQGVGTSSLYFFRRYINVDIWFIRWIISFVINLFVTVIVAEITAFTYNRIFYKYIHEMLKRLGIEGKM